MEYVRLQTVARDVAWFAARTPTLPPATHTNSYALGGREVVLVEPATPFDDERRAWLAWARGLVSAGRQPLGVFVTHHHPDHVGGARFLAEQLELPLWGHATTARLLPELTFARHFDDGETIRLDGPEPQAWECLHTPGHAPGHLCLLERALGVGVVGDMVASEGTIVIDPVEGDLQAYLQQLERLDALSMRVALPAHGAPIDNPSQLFRHYVAHRNGREAKVVSALREHRALSQHSASLAELVARVYADTPTALWPLAELSLESHLIKLVREGRATRDASGWRIVD